MASALFNSSIYIQGRHFIEEITGLDDVFDLLEDWPEERRGLAYDTLLRACREAACNRFPVSAVGENARRFFKAAGILVEVEDVPNFKSRSRDSNVGNV
jgi:Protein of unknown function (DUF982)